MRRLLFALLVLVPHLASARAWLGIEPGAADKNAVLRRFGEPSTRKTEGEKTLFKYSKEQAIDGNAAIFHFDDKHVLREIHVFPPKTDPIDQDTVKVSFGRRYVEKLDESFRKYWWYPFAGLVVFFDAKGKVDSFLFKEPDEQEPKKPAPPTTGGGARPGPR